MEGISVMRSLHWRQFCVWKYFRRSCSAIIVFRVQLQINCTLVDQSESSNSALHMIKRETKLWKIFFFFFSKARKYGEEIKIKKKKKIPLFPASQTTFWKCRKWAQWWRTECFWRNQRSKQLIEVLKCVYDVTNSETLSAHNFWLKHVKVYIIYIILLASYSFGISKKSWYFFLTFVSL